MPLVTLKIFDADGKPVPGAVVSWLRDGVLFNRVNVPANTGIIYLDTANEPEYFADGVRVRSEAFGYTTTETDGSNIGNYSSFTLTMDKTGLNKAVVVGAGIGIAALLLFSKSGKRKVTGFNDIPPAAQTGLVFGAIGLAAYLLFFAGKKPPGAALVTAGQTALSNLAAAGMHPTITNQQAETYASALRTAFNDCGTDEEAVIGVMQRMQNTADVWLLVTIYGTRPYKGCFDGDYFGDHTYNLSEAITAELSSDWINDVNNQFSSNGIDFKF